MTARIERRNIIWDELAKRCYVDCTWLKSYVFRLMFRADVPFEDRWLHHIITSEIDAQLRRGGVVFFDRH